jgi:NAD-dependent deacetylase
LDPQGYFSSFLEVFGEIERARPNPGHLALAELEKKGILKCIITQNVDGLHQKAGSREVMEYHGSLDKFRCVNCHRRFRREELGLEQLESAGTLPPRCPCGGVIKDDGVFFGEPIPGDVLERSQEEALRCDLMLICGTSAVVTPFAYLPRIAKQRQTMIASRTEFGLNIADRIPPAVIIEVNNERTPLTDARISDYLIQGKTGDILPKIAEAIGD